jgi:TonB family protein
VYDIAEDFHEGLAVVMRDDSYGYVDKHGRCTLDYTGSDSSNSLDEEDNYVYDEADVMPQFPGGQEALRRYISSNVRYPKMAFENGVDGKVVVAFVVERDGSITGANAVVKADPLLNKEAIRLIMNMPRWKPGIQNGKPIRVKTTVPVVFRIRKPWE